jgi:hypothetical protein
MKQLMYGSRSISQSYNLGQTSVLKITLDNQFLNESGFIRNPISATDERYENDKCTKCINLLLLISVLPLIIIVENNPRTTIGIKSLGPQVTHP